MIRTTQTHFLFGFMIVTLLGAKAEARPAAMTETATNDDATVTLTVLEDVLVLSGPDTGDAKSWCTIDVEIAGAEKAFTQGDEFRVRVVEDDFGFNETIFDRTVTVTAAEVAANFVDRTFDCTGNFGYDGAGGNLEIRGRLEVTKDTCGLICLQDDALTPIIDVAEVYGDDGAEEDDTSGTATVAGLGTTVNRISKDQDWYTFTLTGPSDITIDVEHRPVAGRLETTLYDPSDNVLSNGSNAASSTQIVGNALPAGTYTLRVLPRDSDNPNFYDLDFAVTAAQTMCTPTDTESRDCGDCGTETRTCQSDGTWGAYGACMNEGVCSPGETESMDCPGGTQTRACDQACEWEPYSACMGTECSGAEMESCYSGRDGTAGVGVCTEGTRTCANGVFGACDDEVVPDTEVCDDGLDNDCDGATDVDDDDCESPASALGTACDDDSECGTLTCIDDSRFVGGYCSETGCTVGDGCAEGSGVCASDTEPTCFALCNGESDCRAGYRCTALPGGDQICYPGCTTDTQCTIEEISSCQDSVCTVPATTNNAPGNNTTSNNETSNNTTSTTGTDASDDEDETGETELATEGGCGCRSTGGSRSVPFAFAFVLLGMVVARARRR